MENPVNALVEGLSRRYFLRQSAAAAMAALAAGNARQLRAGGEKITPTADTLILLWMAGGMAQTETFDPKRYTPFEPGLPSSAVLSTFPSIDTVVDDIKISQGLDRIAKIMDRGTLIRTHRVGDLGHPNPWLRRIWARCSRARSDQTIPICRHLSTSVRTWRSAAKATA